MIGNRQRLNNPLARRLSRHANLSILFRKIEPGMAPLRTLSQPMTSPYQSDVQPVIANLPSSPTDHVDIPVPEKGAFQEITSAKIPKTSPLKPSSPAPTPVESPPSQPVPTSPSFSESDPIWRRLKTIFRKHEQKQLSEASESNPPVQEFPENHPVVDSPTTTQDTQTENIDTGTQNDAPQPDTPVQKLDSAGTQPLPTSQADIPSPGKTFLSANPEIEASQSESVSTFTPATELSQSPELAEDKPKPIEPSPGVDSPVDPEQKTQSALPTQLSQESKEITLPPIQTKETNVGTPTILPHAVVSSRNSSIRSEPVPSAAPQPPITPEKTVSHDAYAHVYTRLESPQPFTPLINEPALPVHNEEISPPPESLPEPTTKTEVSQTQTIPLEQAWPVKSIVSPAPVQLTAMESPVENADVSTEDLSAGEPYPNQQAVVKQILQEVSPAQPSDSSIEVIPPRQPRPLPPIQKSTLAKKETQNIPTELSNGQSTETIAQDTESVDSYSHYQTNIPTEIGPLPVDLWHLIGENPPQTKIQKASESSSPLTSIHNLNQLSSDLISSSQPPSPNLSEVISPPQSSQPELPASYPSIPPPGAMPNITIAAPIQRQAESAPGSPASTTQETGSSAGEGDDQGKKDKEIMELARKVYLEVRKRIFLENERFRMP